MNSAPQQLESAVRPSMHCVTCGYALHGLNAAGHCPECNTPIRRSMYGRELRRADPRWLRRITIGIDLFLISFIAGLLIVIVSEVVTIVSVGGIISALSSSFRQFGDIAGPLLAMGGVFLITTPEPNELNPRRALALTMRGAAIVLVTARVASLTVAPLQPLTLGSTLRTVQLIVFVIILFGVFEHVRAFAARANMPNVTAQARMVKWGLPLLFTLLIAGAWAIAALRGLIAPIGAGFAFLAGLLMLACLGSWAGGVLLVFRIKLSNHVHSIR